MSIQWVATYTPSLDSTKMAMTYVPVGAAVTADQVAIYIGDSVPMYRQVEIIEGWRWLYQGVRERNLLDGPPWQGSPLYTGADISNMTANDRRTGADMTPFTATDVMIGMGANVTATGDKETLHAIFTQLRQFASEATLKAA
jgi:hypothetical protein